MASLEAKQAELQQLQAIETMSSDLVAQLEHVSANFDSLSEGTKVVADVLGRWNELLKVMASRDAQMILMPTTTPDAPPAASEQAPASTA